MARQYLCSGGEAGLAAVLREAERHMVGNEQLLSSESRSGTHYSGQAQLSDIYINGRHLKEKVKAGERDERGQTVRPYR